jgi:short-subunit dehydrogenase
VYRRLLVPPKQPLEYGKWAIVTGSTSGIGKAFATHLASLGMNVCAISRWVRPCRLKTYMYMHTHINTYAHAYVFMYADICTCIYMYMYMYMYIYMYICMYANRSEEKLTQQCTELEASYGVACRHIAYDFTETAAETKAAFYKQLNDACEGMTADGGVGLLVNNVGIANDIPKRIDEFEDSDIQAMIDCNIGSTVYMTTTAMKYMKQRNKGAVLSISSGSGNGPGPFIAVYSATK